MVSNSSFGGPSSSIGYDLKVTLLDVPLIVLHCRVLVLRVTTTFVWETGAVALLANAPFPTAPGVKHCAGLCDAWLLVGSPFTATGFRLCAGLGAL